MSELLMCVGNGGANNQGGGVYLVTVLASKSFENLK